MLFNSIEFLIFFPIVTVMFFIIPKKLRLLWLLIASYFFYMSWNPRYAVLIAISTVITFISGLLLEKIKGKHVQELAVLIVSLVSNLAILGIFKYANFALQTLSYITGFLVGGERYRQEVRSASPCWDFLLYFSGFELHN